MNRRQFVGGIAGAFAGLSAGSKSIAHNLLKETGAADYMIPVPGGRVFHSLADAHSTRLRPGDEILVRDMAQIAPRHIWNTSVEPGKWNLRPYKLADGQSGRLLIVNTRMPHPSQEGLPEEFEIRLNLPGWYAIFLGAPMLELSPIVAYRHGGVDVALDNDPAFVVVSPERGTRLGKTMGPMNVEVICYWKCAELDDRTLRIRVPYGTYLSLPWGMVRASLSCLRLVRLSDQQVENYLEDTSNPKTKRVIWVNDGFSRYWDAGAPGTGIDVRYPQQYAASDIQMYFLQTPAPGVVNYPSKLTDLVGQDVKEEQWKQMRKGDHRVYEYVRWAVKNHQEGFRVDSGLCRRLNLQFHASVRMDNYYKDNKADGEAAAELLNGPFWWKHPQLRIPGSLHLDYVHPQFREYILGILTELATNYSVDGINLDFTRHPPYVGPASHPYSVLTNFIREVRRRLDVVASRKNRKLALSASVVDGYQGSLREYQKIDLEAWLATRTLDFVCVEAWDHSKYIPLAKRFHTPYYAIQDQQSIKYPGGARDDPDWRVKGRPPEDPVAGDATMSQPPIHPELDPTEYDKAFLPRYRMGIDGACIVNGTGNFLRRLGHVEEMAERVKTGKVWGQDNGPGIKVL